MSAFIANYCIFSQGDICLNSDMQRCDFFVVWLNEKLNCSPKIRYVFADFKNERLAINCFENVFFEQIRLQKIKNRDLKVLVRKPLIKNRILDLWKKSQHPISLLSKVIRWWAYKSLMNPSKMSKSLECWMLLMWIWISRILVSVSWKRNGFFGTLSGSVFASNM